MRIKDMSEAQPTADALRFSAWIVLPFDILVQKGFPVKLSYAYDSCLHKKPNGDFFLVWIVPNAAFDFFYRTIVFIF